MVQQTEKSQLANIVGGLLDEVDEAPPLTAWDVFQECLSQVMTARERRVSWEKIADSVRDGAKQAYGVEISLSAKTARDYYSRLTHSKKRKSRKLTSRQNPQKRRSKTTKPATDVVKSYEEKQAVSRATTDNKLVEENQEPTPTESREGQFQKKETRFNLSSRPGAKPINIL